MIRCRSKVSTLGKRYDISRETWKHWRLGYVNHKGELVPPLLTQGLEWDYVNSRCVIYDDELIDSFIRNRSNPEEHLRNVEVYLQSLHQNQKRVGRPAKTPASVS